MQRRKIKMAKVFLCSCNNCGTIYKHNSPKTGEVEICLPDFISNNIQLIITDDIGPLCMKCNTSEHIDDKWYQNHNWWAQINQPWLKDALNMRYEDGKKEKATEIKQALYIFEKL